MGGFDKMVWAIGEPLLRYHLLQFLATRHPFSQPSLLTKSARLFFYARIVCYNIFIMDLPMVLLLAAVVIIFHPFIFLWYGEHQKVKKLLQIAQLGLPQEGMVPADEVTKAVEAKEREIQAKELALNLANKRLDKLDTAKFEFVSVTTHQLRTPLSAIKWTFDMLSKGELGPVTDEQKMFAQKGYESTDRAIEIVNELLKIDSIQEGKDTRANYNFANVDLVELINSVTFLFANQVKARNIELVFNKPASSLVAQVDPKRLHVVFENLLDNAVKYTKPGGRVTVTLSDAKLNSARSVAEILISDTGIGIPEGEQSKIFQRFFRSSNAVKLVTDGNGLGLAIVKDIIDNHQGEIWFESKENAGTTFHLTLPLQQAPLQPN